MKKLFFSLLAIVFSVSAIAQKTQEELRLELAKGMISFNSSLRMAYNQSKDYNDFKAIVCGSWGSKITKEGEDLLAESFRQLKAKTSDEELLRSYSGKEIGKAALWIHNHKGDPIELFGGKTGDFNPYSNTTEAKKCRWWQLWCHLDSIFGPKEGTRLTAFIVDLLMLIFL